MLVSVCLLRASWPYGLYAIMWLFAVVWGADVMAYFGGRLIGGPKLWPRVSPAQDLVGVLRRRALRRGGRAGRRRRRESDDSCCSRSALATGAVAQGGDLFESVLKTEVWRQGFQPSDSRPWRPDGSAGRVHRRQCFRGSGRRGAIRNSSISRPAFSNGDNLLETSSKTRGRGGARGAIRPRRSGSSFLARPARSGAPARK